MLFNSGVLRKVFFLFWQAPKCAHQSISFPLEFNWSLKVNYHWLRLIAHDDATLFHSHANTVAEKRKNCSRWNDAHPILHRVVIVAAIGLNHLYVSLSADFSTWYDVNWRKLSQINVQSFFVFILKLGTTERQENVSFQKIWNHFCDCALLRNLCFIGSRSFGRF